MKKENLIQNSEILSDGKKFSCETDIGGKEKIYNRFSLSQ